MDKTSLVEGDLESAHAALLALDAAGLPIAAAAWLKLRESYSWWFYIASPDVQTYGPTTVYRFVARILGGIGSPLSISSMNVVNTTNHFLNRLAVEVVNKWPLEKEFSNGGVLRAANFSLDDANVEAALIYKIAPNVRSSKSVPLPNDSAIKKARNLAA